MTDPRPLVLLALASAGCFAVQAHGATSTPITPISQSKIPYTINASGSYKLTSNLVAPNGSVTPITVNAPSVTIDLNGFAIIGGNVGIDASNANLVTIFNGDIRGMQHNGIITGHSSRIERVRVFGNGVSGSEGDAILCADGCLVTNSVVNNNTGSGITTERGVVSSNVVQYNGGYGIVVGTGLVTGNAINNNGLNGIYCGYLGGQGAYSNNVLNQNGVGPPLNCVNLGQNACTGAPCP